MDLYQALREMRAISKAEGDFSFTFMSYNATKQSSEGVVNVRRAWLMKRERVEHHRHADIVETYIDLDTMQCRRFYQPLLMVFNGQKVTLR